MAEIADSIASRRALLGGAFGLGGLGVLVAGGGEQAAAAIPTDPSSQFFLTVATIPGESFDEQFPGSIELLTWSFGVTSSATPSSGGASAGKSKPSPFDFVARTSKASPKLFVACASGKHLSSVTLNATRNAEGRVVYLTVKFQNALVTAYQVAPGETDASPLDVVRLNYSRITTTYRSQNPEGTLATTTAGFDFEANKAI